MRHGRAGGAHAGRPRIARGITIPATTRGGAPRLRGRSSSRSRTARSTLKWCALHAPQCKVPLEEIVLERTGDKIICGPLA
eukprot:scaffold12886_cov107-Isochrysis_galbana.AAC.6